MKRIAAVLLALLCLFALTGCMNSMNYVMQHSLKLVGTVEEVHDRYVLVRNDTEETPSFGGGLYQVSTDVKRKDSVTAFSVGDKVAVYFTGEILEIYPAIVKDVQAIVLLEPADRSKNEVG